MNHRAINTIVTICVGILVSVGAMVTARETDNSALKEQIQETRQKFNAVSKELVELHRELYGSAAIDSKLFGSHGPGSRQSAQSGQGHAMALPLKNRSMGPGRIPPGMFMMARGIQLIDASAELSAYFHVDRGVLVVNAPPDSPLKGGDMLVQVGETAVISAMQAYQLLMQPGESLGVEVIRQDVSQYLTLGLFEGPYPAVGGKRLLWHSESE